MVLSEPKTVKRDEAAVLSEPKTVKRDEAAVLSEPKIQTMKGAEGKIS